MTNWKSAVGRTEGVAVGHHPFIQRIVAVAHCAVCRSDVTEVCQACDLIVCEPCHARGNQETQRNTALLALSRASLALIQVEAALRKAGDKAQADDVYALHEALKCTLREQEARLTERAKL